MKACRFFFSRPETERPRIAVKTMEPKELRKFLTKTSETEDGCNEVADTNCMVSLFDEYTKGNNSTPHPEQFEEIMGRPPKPPVRCCKQYASLHTSWLACASLCLLISSLTQPPSSVLLFCNRWNGLLVMWELSCNPIGMLLKHIAGTISC